MTGDRISLKYRFLYCTTTLLLFLALSPHTTVTATIVALATNETFPDRLAAFGPSLSSSQGKLGYLMESSEDPTGCQIVQPPCDDWVALVRRGGCSFVTKVRNMQKSGAIAVAIGDPDQSSWVTMYAPGDTSDIYIPSVFLAQREYQALRYLSNFVDTPMMILLLQIDNWLEWPLMHLVILIFVSPSIVMIFLYISFKLRQRQKLKQDLAPVHVVSRLAVKRFLREKLGENDAEECAICLEDYMDGEKLRVLPCHHTFHTFCVDAWLTTQKKFCPICKRDITVPLVHDSIHSEATSTTVLPLFVEPYRHHHYHLLNTNSSLVTTTIESSSSSSPLSL
ncbi:hypothetical protein BDA99DRAFT_519555 [Phascolomyces articulosus]|uniref:RING-type E3 ubiquitin transferase n=1 Tax=Phascolomyces articulosus TaxID=60185 RepID=A0AAD5PCJ0_9FUNG|nr:hypothetical protein BDA99DRAFT_519555 [Phascolomyces articulosus]